jgi:hypothetical protein
MNVLLIALGVLVIGIALWCTAVLSVRASRRRLSKKRSDLKRAIENFKSTVDEAWREFDENR